MAVTVTETAGSATANSFATVAEADTRLEARLNSSAWTGTEEKKIALIEAGRELSALSWKGLRTDATQALSWPRTGVYNLDDPDLTEYADDAIPQWLKDAQIELALEFLRAGTTDIVAPDPNTGVIRERVDVLETEWASGGSRPVGFARFPRVVALIERYLDLGASGVLEVQRV